jgi:hypothetical protein
LTCWPSLRLAFYVGRGQPIGGQCGVDLVGAGNSTAFQVHRIDFDVVVAITCEGPIAGRPPPNGRWSFAATGCRKHPMRAERYLNAHPCIGLVAFLLAGVLPAFDDQLAAHVSVDSACRCRGVFQCALQALRRVLRGNQVKNWLLPTFIIFLIIIPEASVRAIFSIRQNWTPSKFSIEEREVDNLINVRLNFVQRVVTPSTTTKWEKSVPAVFSTMHTIKGIPNITGLQWSSNFGHDDSTGPTKSAA